MNCLLKLAVLLLASSCAVSAPVDHAFGRKADAGATPSKFHKHGGLLAAGEEALMAVEHAVLRMLKATVGSAEKKAQKAMLKKQKNKAKKQKAKKKCNRQCKKKIDAADKKGLKTCVKKCVKKAMSKKKGQSGDAFTQGVPGYGYYPGGQTLGTYPNAPSTPNYK